MKMRLSLLLLLGIARWMPCSASVATTFFLAPQGNDSNNGTSPNAPFASLQQALLAIQALKQGNGGSLPGPVTVSLAPGIYYLGTTVWITPSDAGDNYTVTFVAPSGGAMLSGGLPLTGWQQDSSDPTVYTTTLGPQGPAFVRSLYTPTERRSLVSTPFMQYAQYNVDSNNHVQVVLQPGQLNATVDELADANIYLYHSWTSSINRISSYVASNDTIIVADQVSDHANGASGNRFRIVNIANIAALQPGTFFFIAASRTITYRAFPGEDPRAASFVVPMLPTACGLMGNSTPVRNVRFVNLTIAHTYADLESECITTGCADQSGSGLQHAAVEFWSAQDVTMEQCEVFGADEYAIWVHEGSANVVISACYLHDLGAGGVRIGEAVSGTAPNPTLLVVNATVTDSEISTIGQIVEAGAGVLLQQAAYSSIVHNDIGQTYYTGISTGWTWGYAATSNTGLNVSFNRIHDIFQGRLSDGGCIYNLGISPGFIADHNECYRVDSFGYGGWGYYDDEGSSQLSWTNNIAYLTKSAGMHQHYGLNNLIQNCIFAYPDLSSCDGASGCDNAGVRSSQHPPGSDPGQFSSFTFVRNIVLLRNATATLFYTTIPTGMKNMTLDYNVYFNEAVPTSSLQFPPTQSPTTFAAWRAEGQDVHSVTADPQFVNAAGYDFSALLPTSPALAMGFQPIDTSAIGPRVAPAAHARR